MHLQVERHRGDHHPAQAPDDEDHNEADGEQKRRPEHRPAGPEGGDPGEDLQGAGDGDGHAGRGVEAVAQPRQAGGEHVMDPEAEGEEGVGDQRQHHHRVGDHGPAGEGGHDHRGHPERRDEDDVDLRVAEEPEQVLPEQVISPLGGVVEVGAHQPVGDQVAGGQHHRRHGEDDHEGGRQHGPQEQRHASQGHAGRAHLHDGGHQLHRDGQGGEFGEGDHLRPDVGALADAVLRARQRSVGEPAHVGADVHGEGDPQEDPAGQVDPVAEGVQPRKGDGPGPAHQRHEVDRHGLHHRHGEEEHHGRAMHGEDLVVEVRPHQVAVRPRQLGAHGGREHAAQHEEGEGRDDVADADLLRIYTGEEAPEALRRGPGLLQARVQLGVLRRRACRRDLGRGGQVRRAHFSVSR